jgi:small subunit ribosomal protein S24e
LDLKIVEERVNPLLKRTEYRFEVDHATQATPTRDEVRTELAKQSKTPKDRVVIERMHARYGVARSEGIGAAYQTKEALQAVVREHIMVRNGLKERAVKGPEATAPAPPAPETPATAPAVEKAPVEKPVPEKPATEKPAPERPAAPKTEEKPKAPKSEEKPKAEKPAAERPAKTADKAADEKPSEKPAAKPRKEKSHAEKPAPAPDAKKE